MTKLLSYILETHTKSIPNQPAIISDNETITYSEFSALVSKTILSIKETGLTPEHTVALRFHNPTVQFIFYFALLNMGICQVSINPNDVINIQNQALSLVDIALVFQETTVKDILTKQTVFVDSKCNILFNGFNFIPNIYVKTTNSSETAIVFQGSGTTAQPKIIGVSRAALREQIIRDSQVSDVKTGDNYYTYTDLYYMTPKRRIISALYKGLCVFLPKVKPQNIASFCINNNINHLALTTNQAIIMLSKSNSDDIKQLQLKSLIVSSSMILELVRKKILENITKNLYIGYGTNELGEITVATYKDIQAHEGTVGKPLNGISLRIVNDNGKDCMVGEVGNILVKSGNMITEYINNPEATKKTFTQDGYYPGDLGKMTEDGNLILEGRKDDMMIFSGVNIYPRELEEVLESHPNVIESAVFPLNINNNDGIPIAVVVINNRMNESELLQWCHQRLGWRRPQRILFSKILPRNDAGKILKRVLAQQVVKVLNAQNNSSTNNQ